MTGNQLTSLPESIEKLTKLEALGLRDNNLTSLPESIEKLTKLEVLVLYQNKLTSLPESIGKLTKLGQLWLNKNKLTSLPESIGKLTKLQILELTGNKLTSLPPSIKNLNNVEINYDGKEFRSGLEFYKYFYPPPPVRVSKKTELFNSSMYKTNKISNIPTNKRVYINTPSNVKNNGELRRLYNKNGIKKYMRGKTTGRLHGGNFRMSNVKNLKNTNLVIKNVYLRNIKGRLINSSLNNFNTVVTRIKSNLPSNVSRNDVNNVVRKMKPQVLKKIFNKLKNSPPNKRNGIMTTMKNRGLMTTSDINNALKKLMKT